MSLTSTPVSSTSYSSLSSLYSLSLCVFLNAWDSFTLNFECLSSCYLCLLKSILDLGFPQTTYHLKLGSCRPLVCDDRDNILRCLDRDPRVLGTCPHPSLDIAFYAFSSLRLCFVLLNGSSLISAAAVVLVVESCSLSSGTDASMSDSVPDHVPAWGCGTSSVAGTISVASLSILCGKPDQNGGRKRASVNLTYPEFLLLFFLFFLRLI